MSHPDRVRVTATALIGHHIAAIRTVPPPIAGPRPGTAEVRHYAHAVLDGAVEAVPVVMALREAQRVARRTGQMPAWEDAQGEIDRVRAETRRASVEGAVEYLALLSSRCSVGGMRDPALDEADVARADREEREERREMGIGGAS